MGAYRSLRCSGVAGTGRTGDGSSEAAVGGEAAGAGDESLKKKREYAKHCNRFMGYPETGNYNTRILKANSV